MVKRKRRKVHACVCASCRAHPHSRVAKEHKAINRVLVTLDERTRRHVAGLLARQLGRGGTQRLGEITGLSRNTIRRGQRELGQLKPTTRPFVRRPGGGRWSVEKRIPS